MAHISDANIQNELITIYIPHLEFVLNMRSEESKRISIYASRLGERQTVKETLAYDSSTVH